MDPLGFSLENFDALGRWRTTSDGVAIDASASLPDGARFDGVAGLKTLLLNHREDFVRTFTDRLLSYAIGRGTGPSDWPAVRRIVRETAPQDHRWSAIILAIVRSTPFTMTEAGRDRQRVETRQAGQAAQATQAVGLTETRR
jgi:hypothetical protein